MTKTDPATRASQLTVFGTVIAVVASLYLAQEVLIPIALATLLSFLLAPLVRRLERWRLPRPVAVVVAVCLAFAVLAGVGFVVYNQLTDLGAKWPAYAENLRAKVAAVEGPGGMFNRIRGIEQQVREVTGTAATHPATGPAAAAAAGPPPTRVEVVGGGEPAAAAAGSSATTSPIAVVRDVAMTVLGPAGVAFIVVVLTVFMLLQREDLRDRFLRLAGRDQLTTSTQALDDAAGRVSQYLLLQFVVNGSVGLLVTASLWAVGHFAHVPFPSLALWGLLAMLLRFIPYVGIWIAAAIPVLLSLAVFSSAKVSLAVLGCYFVVELTVSNAVEPMLYGGGTGIATLAVLVAAAFWTWLWGPIGLFLSTPLTVCLVVMGKYVPQLAFLTILLGDEPALSPPDRVYQRLLADDPEEATDLVHEYAKSMPLEQLYDELLVPALRLAEVDDARGKLDAKRYAQIHAGVRDIIDELGDLHRAEATAVAARAAAAQAKGADPATAAADALAAAAKASAFAPPPPGSRVLLPKECVVNVACIPAHDPADEACGRMLAQLLELRGYCVTVFSSDKLAGEMVAAAAEQHADAVVVSSLPPAAVAHARYLCKRLGTALPDVDLVVGLWTHKGDPKRTHDRVACVSHVRVATTLRDAVAQLHQIVQPKLIATDKSAAIAPA